MSASILLVSILFAPAEPVESEAVAEVRAKPESRELERAARPALGLKVRSVSVDTGAEQYRLTERSWDEVVRSNPALAVDQRRTELFAPGLAGAGLGAVWLTIATAVTMDQFAERDTGGSSGYSLGDDRILTARAVTFRFVLPSALLISGVALAVVGGRARQRLDAAHRAFYLGPQISHGGGGLTVGGMF